MDQNRIVRRIPCGDVAKRDRHLLIIAVPGQLSFVAPPGEVANIEPRQYEAVRQALLEALPVAWSEAP